MYLAAVTGTNGKTTVVELTRQLLSFSGYTSASLGTLGLITDLRKEEHISLIGKYAVQDILQELERVDEVNAVIFEAYSSCLENGYYGNIDVNVAAFTNLSEDHLEYHRSYESYRDAKLKLFTDILGANRSAVVNCDDELSNLILTICDNKSIDVVTYGKSEGAILRIIGSKPVERRSYIEIKYRNKRYRTLLPFIGDVFIIDWLCAVGIGIQAGIAIEHLLTVSDKLMLPPGRLEYVESFNSAEIFIDYAHNPDALKEILLYLNKFAEGQLHLVFGCGGDRDKRKRKKMGEIADLYADYIYITDDNPRSESSREIRYSILKGCKRGFEIECRQEAIISAMNALEQGDILLIAGKGHETYQLKNNGQKRLSDRELVLNQIKGEKLCS